MGFVLRKLGSLLTRKITKSRYTAKCLICFMEKENLSRGEAVEFLFNHARWHAMNWDLRYAIRNLYNPFRSIRYVHTSQYMITKEE